MGIFALVKQPVAVTVVLTSCNRFDRLDRTLSSFAATNDYPIARFILIEDSGLEAVTEVIDRYPSLGIELILNRPNLGQYASIDRAYREVNTEFIFHSEDDWQFLRPRILAESVALLEADPSIAVVWPRGDEGAPRWIKKTPRSKLAGVDIRPIDPRAHHRWGNFTFNPGLRRLSHYRMMPGGYATYGEGGTSIFLKRHGLRMVILAETGVAHIGGDGRSTGAADALLKADNPVSERGKMSKKISRAPTSLLSRLSHTLWRAKLFLRLLFGQR